MHGSNIKNVDWKYYINGLTDDEKLSLRAALIRCIRNHLQEDASKDLLCVLSEIGGKLRKYTALELYDLASQEGKLDRLINAMLDYPNRGDAVLECLLRQDDFKFVLKNHKVCCNVSTSQGKVASSVKLKPISSLDETARSPTDAGVLSISVQLPYTEPELAAILKALDIGNQLLRDAKDPSPDYDAYRQYREILKKQAYLSGGSLNLQKLYRDVGQQLYTVLFPEESEQRKSLNEMRRTSPTNLQLYFAGDDKDWGRYPWELLHDGGSDFLGVDTLDITRHIAGMSCPPLPTIERTLRMLYIAPRFKNDDRERDEEIRGIKEAFQPLQNKGKLICTFLAPSEPQYATWGNLVKTIEDCDANAPYHIVHFDGHGAMLKKCPNPDHQPEYYCRPATLKCDRCETSLANVLPEMYLEFESENRQKDRVAISDFAQIIKNQGVRLVVLSACESGLLREESEMFFSGTTALIGTGIPAVIGFQGNPEIPTVAKFMKALYTKLAKGEKITQAVLAGRRAILRTRGPCQWFKPVIYMCNADSIDEDLFGIS